MPIEKRKLYEAISAEKTDLKKGKMISCKQNLDYPF
jgi:hypothetical protein